VLAAAMAAATAAYAKPSNPAFLGIGMRDLQGMSTTQGVVLGPCLVESVTRGSGAMEAGLLPGDMLVSIDGVSVPSCDVVQRVIQARQPGDTVKIVLRRYGRPMTVDATLVARDEILRRRLVGQPLGALSVWSVDQERALDLGAFRGRVTILGWFERSCDGCAQVFSRLATWSRVQDDRLPVPVVALGVTRGAPGPRDPSLPALEVPLALAAPEIFEELTIPDRERIFFIVVDPRGVVRYVTPVAPKGDDLEAVLDELFAAATQAARRATR
jgi:hypothetical protein